MKTKRFPFRILSIILIFTAVLVPMIAVSASGAGAAIDYTQYDLSKPGSRYNVELDVSDFIGMIDGKSVSDLEKSYLLDYSYINVKYDEPTSQYVTVTAKDDAVTVSASPYSYTTALGKSVTWYPVSASVYGVDGSVPLVKTDDKYVGVISGVEIDNTTSVNVTYKLDFEFVIGKADINPALNAAYNSAVNMKNEYNSASDSYNKAYDEYLAYLESQKSFDEDLAKYEQYLEDYAYYLEDLNEYNEYLKAMVVYEENLAKYEEYLEKVARYQAYVDYVNNYSNLTKQYERDLANYNQYLADMETVKAQINMLDTGLYDKVTVLERDLYSCMFASLVDQVVENRDLFVSGAGANPYSIDGANTATTNIRNMLTEYNTLESEADKYGFYINNYEAMRDNISLLAACLYDLYLNDMIKTGMHSEEKTEKYVIMVAQLVIFANALTDGSFSVILPDKNGKDQTITLDKNSTMTYLTGTQQPYGKVTKNMVEILEGNEYVADLGNATPLSGGYPTKVDEPTKPVDWRELEVPETPSYVSNPKKPETVEEPTPPEVVEDPRNVEPVAEPVRPAILDDENYKTTIAALECGEIAEREEIDEDFIFVPEVTLEKTVISSENVTVTFYDHDNTTVLSRIITTKYSSVEYEGEDPKKPADDKSAYYFIGWVDSEGNEVDLDFVETDIALYPSFRVVDFIYLEFYAADRETLLYSLKFEEGNSASYEGELPTKTDDYAVYTFDCWVDGNGNKYDLDKPTASAKLYPSFTALPYVFINFYDTDGKTVLDTEKVLLGESASYEGPVPQKTPDPEADYVFFGWQDADGNPYDLANAAVSADLYPAFTSIPYVFITFYDTDGITVLDTARVRPGASVTFDGEDPVKAADPEADYIFFGWADKSGNAYDLANAAVSADLYPAFTSIRYVVVKFYAADGETLLYYDRVRPGSSVNYNGDTPVKEAEPEANYTFVGWADKDGNRYDLTFFSDSVNLYPAFNKIRYTVVNFYDYDKVLLQSYRVRPGTSVSFAGEPPVRESLPEEDYIFLGWFDIDGNSYDLTAVDASVDLYPSYKTERYVVIKFYGADLETVIYTARVKPGEKASFDGEVPTKEPTPEEGYVFAGWVDSDGNAFDLASPVQSAELYPSFTVTSYIILNFYGVNGEHIAEKRILKGVPYTFDGETPTKEPTLEEGYVFTGWADGSGNMYDLTCPEVSADLYPQFSVTTYIILTFHDENGELIAEERILKGVAYTFGGEAPSKESESDADYVFDGWVDEYGNKYDLNAPNTTASLYPSFIKVSYATLNFYGTDRVTLIGTYRAHVGSSLKLEFDDPVKESEPEADYVFNAWVDQDGYAYDLTCVSVSADLYPDFTVIPYAVVEFYDTDGTTLLYSERVERGSPITFVGKAPTKASESEVDYIFSGWVDENGNAYDLDAASYSATLYPAFTEVRFVIVSFYDTDGETLLDYVRVRSGASVEFGAKTPVKPTDSVGAYKFSHWVDASGAVFELDAVNASADLYPYFTVTPFVTVTFLAADGITVLDIQTVLLGSSVTYAGEIPVKGSDPEADYSFCAWVDASGTEYDLSAVGGAVSLYPSFSVTEYVVVTFLDTDGVTVIDEVRVLKGSAVRFTQETPVKDADSEAVYSFDAWVDENGVECDLSACHESVKLHPSFKPTYYLVITFYGADGVTVLYTDKILPGASAQYAGEHPEKASDPEADYTFDGSWLDGNGNVFDITSPESSVSLYPSFKSTRYIVVRFFSYDLVTVLDSFRVRPGESTIYSGDTPVRAGDYDAEYSFSHWTYENGEPYSFERLGYSADFYPAFDVIPYFTVTFYGEDRVSVLDTHRVLSGGSAAYGGALPEKVGDSTAEYKFSHWMDENGEKCDPIDVTASIDLYPSFVSVPYVTLTFIGLDGSVLYSATVLQGESAVFEGETPVKESDIIADYVFDGWTDESGAIFDLSAVSGAAVLYPHFDVVYKEYELDTDYNGTGITQYSVDLGDVELIDIPLEHFISVSTENRSALLIKGGGVSVRFSYASVSAMRRAGAASFSVKLTRGASGYECAVILEDADGNVIDDSLTITVSFVCEDADFVESASIVYIDADGKQQSVSKKYIDGVVSFSARTGVSYEMFTQYDVGITKDLPIDLVISDDRAEPGALISVTTAIDVPAGKLLELYYYDTDANKHVIENNSFVMPEGHVMIGATLTDIIYTVTFVSDGKVLAQNQYKYGDTVIVPRDPSKQNDATYSYTFTGWSEEIGAVTSDVTYYAEFEATPLPSDDTDGIQIADKYLRIIRIVAIIAAIFVGMIVVLIFTKRPRGFNPY